MSVFKINSDFPQSYSNNFPEKIVFVIDTIHESDATQFKLSTGDTYTSLYMVKRVIEIFSHNKLMLSPKHEFAIITLDSKEAYWICDFTKNLKSLLNKLESIEEAKVKDDRKYFDMQKAFDLVYQHIVHETCILQENVVRIILLYARSTIIPRFNITEIKIQELINNANFFLDVLYIHERSSPENKCEEIYVELTKLDIKSVSYIMEVARSAVKLHNYMARLLAHPIQRVLQKDIRYNIHPSIIKAIQENKLND